jgi:WD40 repeat protein
MSAKKLGLEARYRLRHFSYSMLFIFCFLFCGQASPYPPAVPRSFPPVEELSAAAFSLDGRYLLAGFNPLVFAGHRRRPEGNMLRLWDVRTGEEVKRFPGHVNGTTFVGFLPGGEEAISTGMDGVVRIWGIKEGKEFRSFRASERATYKADVSKDGRFLLAFTGDEGKPAKLKLFDVGTGRELATYGFDKCFHSLTISAKGKWGVIECESFIRKGKTDRTGLQIWDLEKRVAVRSYAWTRRFPPFPEREWSGPAAISPDEKFLVALTKHPQNDSFHFGVMEIESGKPVTGFEGRYSNETFFIGFTPNGAKIVSASTVGVFTVMDSRKGKVLLEKDMTRPKDSVLHIVVISPDSTKLFAAFGWQMQNQDMRLDIWDIATGEKIQTLSSPK